MAAPGIKKKQLRNTKTHQSGVEAERASRSGLVPDSRHEEGRPDPAVDQIARLAYSYTGKREREKAGQQKTIGYAPSVN